MLANGLVGNLGGGYGLLLEAFVKGLGLLDGGFQLGSQGAALFAGLARGGIEHFLAFAHGGAKIMQGLFTISVFLLLPYMFSFRKSLSPNNRSLATPTGR